MKKSIYALLTLYMAATLGCSQQQENLEYARLNDDNIPDIVEIEANNKWGYMGIDITARLSQPDGTYEKKVMARFPEKPYHWELRDEDKDGLDDIVYTKRVNEDTYKTYVKINKGGEFLKARPLN